MSCTLVVSSGITCVNTFSIAFISAPTSRRFCPYSCICANTALCIFSTSDFIALMSLFMSVICVCVCSFQSIHGFSSSASIFHFSLICVSTSSVMFCVDGCCCVCCCISGISCSCVYAPDSLASACPSASAICCGE